MKVALIVAPVVALYSATTPLPDTKRWLNWSSTIGWAFWGGGERNGTWVAAPVTESYLPTVPLPGRVVPTSSAGPAWAGQATKAVKRQSSEDGREWDRFGGKSSSSRNQILGFPR